MESGAVFIALLEHDAAEADTALFRGKGIPWPLKADDFDPNNLQRGIGGQAGCQRFFLAERPAVLPLRRDRQPPPPGTCSSARSTTCWRPSPSTDAARPEEPSGVGVADLRPGSAPEGRGYPSWPMGPFDDVYRRSIADPEGFWGEAAEAIDWDRRRDGCSTTADPPFYRWFPGGRAQHLLQRPRPPRRRRGAATASGRSDLRQPGHRARCATSPTASCCDEVAAVRRRARRPRASARATGSSSTCRWCPRPSSRMLACARLGAVHSVVFGGFAPHELADPHRRRPPQGDRLGVLRHRGQQGHRVQAAARPGDRAGRAQAAEHCVILQRPQVEAAARRRAATSTGTTLMAAPSRTRLRAGRGHRPALHPLHLGHDRQAQGRRARQRRPRRRPALDACRTSTTSQPGEVFWAASDVGWVVGHSYIVYAPAAHRLHDGALRGQAGGHARRRGVLAGRRRARREGAVHRADRDPGHQEGGPERRAARPATTCRAARRSSWPASASTPTPTTGPATLLGIPVIDHWWQTETGWPIAANCLRHRAAAGQAGLAHPAGARATTSRSSTRRRPRSAPGREDGTIAMRLPLPPGDAADPVAATTRASCPPTSRPSPATTSPATAATSTRTATCSSWAASTTSSTSPATGCPPGRWRRCSPPTPTWPSARSSASPTSSRARCRVGFVVLKAGRRRPTGGARRPSWWRMVRERDRRRSPRFKQAVVVAPPAQDALGQDPARHDAPASPTARPIACRPPSTTRRPRRDRPGPGRTRLPGAGGDPPPESG